MTEIAERWRPVPGYEGWYDVSDQGRVRSWHTVRRFAAERAAQPHLLKLASGRYQSVVLCGEFGRRTWAVHQVVALAYLGPRPEGQEVRHLNGDNWDCRLVNLAYGTPKDNHGDTVKHGTAWYVRPESLAQWKRSRQKVGA